MFSPKASSQMLHIVLHVPIFVVNEFLHGFDKTIRDTTKSIKIKLTLILKRLAVLRVKKKQ